MTQRYLIRFYSATSCAETEVTMNRSIVRMFYGIFELPVDVMMYLRYLKTILVFKFVFRDFHSLHVTVSSTPYESFHISKSVCLESDSVTHPSSVKKVPALPPPHLNWLPCLQGVCIKRK